MKPSRDQRRVVRIMWVEKAALCMDGDEAFLQTHDPKNKTRRITQIPRRRMR